jgi:endonuclease/exonuclease/phosphatase family metal-dependent hydrolase
VRVGQAKTADNAGDGEANTMRLVSYNVLDGGEGRADPLAEVILAQRPDVVALLEADDAETLGRIARRLEMDFIQAPAAENRSSALLSRWPITDTINHAAANPRIKQSFLEATVQAPDGIEWPIGVLHLPPGATEHDENERMHPLAIVLDLFKEHRRANRPHILCGDFNANAPYQRIDPALCKIKTQQAWDANSGRLPHRVIEAMTGVGYSDTYRLLHDEQSAEMIGSFTTQHPGQRVDYIFTWAVPPASVKDAWVEQDRLAKYASDHFPIGVEIQGLS